MRVVGNNGGDVDVVCQQGFFDLPQLELEVKCLLLESQHFEGLCSAIRTRLVYFTVHEVDLDFTVKGHVVVLVLPRARLSYRCVLFALIAVEKVVSHAFVLGIGLCYALPLFFELRAVAV